jgi:chemotaxis protein histidine kinase CheA
MDTTPAPAAAAAGGSIMPPGSENKEAESILKQADMLKEQLNAKDKATQEQQQTLEKERSEKTKLLDELAYYRQKAQAEAKAYAKEQEPKYKEYVAALEEQTGKKFDEEKKKRIYNTFTDPRLKDDVDDMWKVHQHTVSVTAAKHTAEEERKKEKEQYEREKIKLTETLSKAAQSVGSMRATYAQALAPQVSEIPKVENDSYRKSVDVTAGLHLSDLMEVPQASKYDQTVLKVQQ